MGFFSKVVDWVPIIGKAALGMLPGGGVATTVLEGIGKIAETIKGNEGEKINNGLRLVTEGLKSVGERSLTGEEQIELNEVKSKTEIALAKIVLEEKKLPFKDQAGGRKVIKAALQSKDKVVRQARSKIMTKLGYAAIGYSFFSVLIMIWAMLKKIDQNRISLLVEMLTWQGGMIWTSFTTSFSGYTVVKYNEKRIEKGIPSSSVLKTMAKLGQMVS